MTLRMRELNNLEQLPILMRTALVVSKPNRCETASTGYGPTSVFNRTGKCFGTQKVVFDEFPSFWDRRIPTFRDFEVRSGSGGYDDAKLTVSYKYPECPKPFEQNEYTGPLAAFIGGFSYDTGTALDIDPTAADRALQRAWAAVTEPDVDFGENIVQMKQTLQMIHSPLKAVAGGLRRMVKGLPLRKPTKPSKKSVTVKDAIEEIESRWLEARYGLLPLMLDVKTGMKRYAEQFAINFEVMVAHGDAPVVTSRVVSEVLSGSPHPYVNFLNRIETTDSAKTRACVYHQNVFGDTVNPVLYGMGLHPSQLLNLAWNTVPLSFVVDWVWDVSGFISSLNPAADKIHYGNTVSFKTEKKVQRTLLKAETILPYIANCRSCGAQGITRKYKRVKNWTYPQKLLRGADLSSVHRVIDALALTAQNIPRFFRGR